MLIEITPVRTLIDEPISIVITDCTPGHYVTLRAELRDDLDKPWQSAAIFVADENGVIDLEREAPVSGSYTTVDPMGMVWSMTQSGDGPPAFFVQNKVTPLTITFTAEAPSHDTVVTTAERLRIAEGVTRHVIRENGLFGTLFLPAGDGPHPAVIVLTGSGGGITENRAALFASHGYAGFALAYFNYETLPKNLVEIPLEYFEAAIQWLQAHPKIDGQRLAASGGSRGGELSLLLGATFPQIKAVVAYVPSAFAWGGISGDPEEMAKPAWTYRGKPVPFLPAVNIDKFPDIYTDILQRGDPIPLMPAYAATMENAANAEDALISIEKTNGAILLLSGADDQMSPSSRFSDIAIDWLNQHEFAHPYKHISYPDAGHLILTPYIPATITESFHPIRQNVFAFGGKPERNAYALEDSWKQALVFLAANL